MRAAIGNTISALAVVLAVCLAPQPASSRCDKHHCGPEELAQTSQANCCSTQGGNVPYAGYQFPYAPNPFTTPLCASDPCSPTLDPNSTSIVSQIITYGGTGFGLGEVQEAEPGTQAVGSADTFPTYYVTGTEPTYTVTCSQFGGCGAFMPANVPIPNGARASFDSDHHAIVINTTAGYELDMWEFNDAGTGTGTTNLVSGGGSVSTGFASYCTLTSYVSMGVCHGTAVAAGVANQPGIIDPRAWVNGAINHAIFVSVACPDSTFVWPARASDGTCSAGPPDGEYIWLDLTDAQINALSVLPWAKVYLHAMHDYGLMVVDSVGNAPDSDGPWELYGMDNYTMTLWGQPEPWTQFFNYLIGQGQSVTYSNNASHIAIPFGTITQSNVHIVE